VNIRQGGPADVTAVMGFFDEAVEWMVARGQTGQWGTEPLSKSPRMVARVQAWARAEGSGDEGSARGGGLWMAEIDGEPVGALVVGERPDHVHPVGVDELYVELLLSSRRHAGKRIGAKLVAHARTLAAGRLLRVDCWAGAPRLVRFYEEQGFVRDGTFVVGGWHGQVLSMEA
jgi:GNAT superfamily N-acetyltransferase